MRPAMMLCSLLAVVTSAQTAIADATPLRGIARVVTSIGTAGPDPAEPCGLNRDALDRLLLERLRAAGLGVITVGELLATYRSHVDAVRATTRLIRRGESLPPGHAEAQRRRDEEGEALRVRPNIGISFASVQVSDIGGEPRCAVAMNTRVVGLISPSERRVVLGGTGRQVVVPLLLWESGLRMTVLSASGWEAGLAAELDREADRFLEQWRRQNGK